MQYLFANILVVSPDIKKGPQGLLHSVMKGDSKSLFSPVIELFLLPGRGGFSRPDKDFLPREQFRTRRINGFCQDVNMPAFL